jgi:site-specific DNA-methyltransferase (adenine-specific)
MEWMTATKKKNPQPQLSFRESKFAYTSFVAPHTPDPHYVSEFGALWADDCLKILPKINDEVVDTVFADPPFNLGKEYGARSNDNRPDYLEWCYAWLSECVRILKPGGSLFVYNLPKWNIPIGAFLGEKELEFRHWIAVEMSACLPIPKRLHPSHYSLLYYTKGKPKTFRRIRTPIMTCRHCKKEIKDYGGHRAAMNPDGVTLKDVWSDIPPVRHSKFKSGDRKANALSTKLLDRVVEMSTQPGEIVFDPFGGSGTTFAVCEAKHRHWLGTELDFSDVIVDRIESDDIRSHRNDDFVEA